MDGPSLSEGYVELLHGGRWGTVCKAGFDNTAAAVACRELGYSSGGAPVVVPRERGAPTHMWLSGVSCGGSEASLAACRHDDWGVHDCDDWDDHVYVSCEPGRYRGANGWRGRSKLT